MVDWEVVIGLEIHAQLATRSKIFSGAATAYGAPPNTQASLVDLAYPGVLPVLNAEAVRMAVKFGLAIGATVARRSIFARKNYFYPDLPKGYQISQYEHPVVSRGSLNVLWKTERSRPSESRAPTSRRMPASRCTKDWPMPPASTSTAPVRRCWKSSPSRICVRPRRPWRT